MLEVKIELGEEQSPPRLSSVQLSGVPEVGQILVVRQDFSCVAISVNVVSLGF